MANSPGPILIAGPTAVGKSELALHLAERLNGEIISVDSMQVYRGLDIGTAKPSPEERQRVPHHLIDVVDLTAPFDAAQFIRLAQAAVTDIQGRGQIPIFCGGTGLYFKAYLEGLGEAPPADDALRAELEKTPLPELLKELAGLDPVTYDKIDCQNPRRVIRAVEVIRLTGKPFSAQRAAWAPPTTPHSQAPPFFALSRENQDLHSRINVRVDQMFQRGLVAEVKNLMSHGLAENKNAMQAIGYRQVVEHLRGEHSLPETIELVKIRTRQFAKRQMTWFRRQAQAKWISVTTTNTVKELAAQLQQSLPLS
ncbi:tRNA (adenosine(37)-N6)-dimethylallyltransferase MiaA [Pedosphaera parvula]|uniref:tRNA dimethylallyltransferase n=1 Tax=Pedosphaera parvula (strain Ellin514) TaxID=320771 RepID=B9XPW4_PEDPL|nr:tRNA (adenosine(37)-N6)-dimethylallyltransferase MiaA [Pedosphaera parvula]EEF58145.1 tRNA delta(2)-isopentenylpyrophosphate transferase [Pedosphaera parvula Ellin514]